MKQTKLEKYKHYQGIDGRFYAPQSCLYQKEGGDYLIVEVMEDDKFYHIVMHLKDFKKFLGISERKGVIICDT